MQHLGGPDDQLNQIHNEMKQLKEAESLHAIIHILGVARSMDATIAEILNTVKKMSTAFNTMTLDQSDEKVLTWLKSVDTSLNHDLAREKHEPTTGNWFLESKHFDEWTKATKASLWLQGNPGAGKTILCSTIIEDVKQKCNSTPCDQYAYFYFDFREKRTVVDMLRTVIVQLCARKKEVPNELHSLYQQCSPYHRQPTQTELVKILEFSSLLSNSHRTFVIMDALDECPVGADRTALLKAIEDMIRKSSKYLNVLVTSRKERDIVDKLEPLIDNSISLKEDDVDPDIVLHIQECLRKDAKLRQWDDMIKKKIQRDLTEKAHGMYYPNLS
jgi:ankyrin repeat domain-containing protein 50